MPDNAAVAGRVLKRRPGTAARKVGGAEGVAQAAASSGTRPVALCHCATGRCRFGSSGRSRWPQVLREPIPHVLACRSSPAPILQQFIDGQGVLRVQVGPQVGAGLFGAPVKADEPNAVREPAAVLEPLQGGEQVVVVPLGALCNSKQAQKLDRGERCGRRIGGDGRPRYSVSRLAGGRQQAAGISSDVAA